MKTLIANFVKKICKIWFVVGCVIVGIFNLLLFLSGVPIFDIANNRTSILLIIYVAIIILLSNKRQAVVKYLIQLSFSLLLLAYGVFYLKQIIDDQSVKFSSDTAHMYLFLIAGSIVPSILLFFSTACSFFWNKNRNINSIRSSK